MKNIFLTLLLLVVVPLTLDARRNGEGFFLGYGIGATHYNDSGAIKDFGGTKDNFSGSGKLYMGYKYDHQITLEGSFTNYGYFEANKGSDTYAFAPMSGAVYLNYGHDFYHNQIRPFVILGAGLLWINDRSNAIYDEEIFFSAHYGFGLLYTPNWFYGWGVRYAYEGDWSRFDTKNVEGTNLNGGGYNNFLGTVYLGIQYKF